MGYNSAVDMAGQVDIDTALAWHLQSNHYPPVPASMIEPCKEAIDAYWEEDADRMIDLPEGISYRGETTAPAWAIASQHHLDAWLPNLDDMSD